jgi:hypothetical protein
MHKPTHPSNQESTRIPKHAKRNNIKRLEITKTSPQQFKNAKAPASKFRKHKHERKQQIGNPNFQEQTKKQNIKTSNKPRKPSFANIPTFSKLFKNQTFVKVTKLGKSQNIRVLQ